MRFILLIWCFSLTSIEHVARNKHIYCTEASVLLAYSIYERAKDVSIYTFSGRDDGDLEDIHPSLIHNNFEHAKQICEQKTVSMIPSYHQIRHFFLKFLAFFIPERSNIPKFVETNSSSNKNEEKG